MALSIDEIKEFINADLPSHGSVIMELISGAKYQTVRYRGNINRIDYEQSDTFYALGPKSPSDCLWMIPSGIGATVEN